jgi:cytochrome b561
MLPLREQARAVVTTSTSRPATDVPVGSRSYGRTAVLLHWLLALCLLGQLALGWWMLDIPKEPPGMRASWFNLHKSIGLMLTFLVIFGLAWRTRHPVAQAAALPPWQRRAARRTHAALHVCMLVIPLSGYLGSSFSGYPVRFFGWVLPTWTSSWAAGKQAMSSLHYAAVCLFMALLLLHIGAALWHVLRRDDIAERMGLTGLRRGST